MAPRFVSFDNVRTIKCGKFSPAFSKRRHGSNDVERWSRSAEREISP